MADWLTPEQRRHVMQSIRSRDTGPELAVRRILHRLGFRYRLHKKGLPGRPDLVFGPRRKVIFVHGCFWHAHDCRYGRAPQSRQEYWIPKLKRNRERDLENKTALEALGWNVLTVWECEIRDTAALVIRLTAFLNESQCKLPGVLGAPASEGGAPAEGCEG